MTRMLIKQRQRKKQTQRQRQRQTKPVDFEEQAIEHQQKPRDRNRSTRRSIHVLVWRSLWHLHCSDSLLFLGVLACSGLVACRVVASKMSAGIQGAHGLPRVWFWTACWLQPFNQDPPRSANLPSSELPFTYSHTCAQIRTITHKRFRTRLTVP